MPILTGSASTLECFKELYYTLLFILCVNYLDSDMKYYTFANDAAITLW